MKTRKSLIVAGVVALAALATLVLFTGLTQAQEPGPEREVQLSSPAGVTAVMSDAIPIQGRLTDTSGNPLNGNYNMTFSLYTAESGGTAVCSSNYPALAVTDGLFAANVTGCTAGDINGAQLYLGVTVGTDAEMTPRQPIYAVPYARSLRPGAQIGGPGAGDGTLSLWSASSPDYTIRLNGGTGDLTLGGIGLDGDVSVWDASGTLETFHVDGAAGDVSQVRFGDGLVKAGVYAECNNTAPSITRSFNNVNTTPIAITIGASAGKCGIDFGFRIDDRFFVATALDTGLDDISVTCTWGASNDTLVCFRHDSSLGNGDDGPIMVLIY